MKAIPSKKREWHNLVKAGSTPAEVGELAGVPEAVVVHTLRHPTPKIKGANYSGLRIPIPQSEVIEAYHANTMNELGEKYGVTATTIKSRLPEELRKRKTKTYRKKVDKLTDKDKTEAVNAYYQSGRKLNCTELTPNILRQILKERGVKEKQSNPIKSVYVVRLMDSILSDTEILEKAIIDILKVQRLLVGLTGDDPVAWKGQLFDMMLNGTLSEESARLYSRAIDRVARFIGYEED